MRRRIPSYSLVGTLCLLLFMSSLVLSGGCGDWGMAAYGAVGLVCAAVLMAVPYVARRAFHRGDRLPIALGFLMLGVVTWLLGWFIVFWRSGC